LLVKPTPRNVNLGNGRFAMFNKERDISGFTTIPFMASCANAEPANAIKPAKIRSFFMEVLPGV
jgi:hypothetical protein